MFFLIIFITIILTAGSLFGLRWFFPTLSTNFERSELLSFVILLFLILLIEAAIISVVAWWQRRRLQTRLTKQEKQLQTEREFVSLAAHQLRTPLSALKWSLDMIQQGEIGPLSSEQTNFVSKINTTNNQLITLVNDLLNVSRIEEQRMIFTPETFDIVQKTKDVLEMVQKSYPDKNLSVKFDAPARAIMLTLDSGKFAMALTNIIDNAFKYTPAGGTVTITLTTKNSTANWTIIDSGVGIPRAQQKRLFEKFFRADNAIKTQVSGTGLGLYLAHKIIEHERGHLIIASAEGKGTTVTITIPLHS